MYNTFGNVLEGQGKTVIMVASTRIAATLLLNGATYHSTFKIYPSIITDTTTSKIEEHSYIAKLIREASLIICYEATTQTEYFVLNTSFTRHSKTGQCLFNSS
jgi:ATP-dependent DNA helicase PIF1